MSIIAFLMASRCATGRSPHGPRRCKQINTQELEQAKRRSLSRKPLRAPDCATRRRAKIRLSARETILSTRY
ncbi:hypothetical protein KCP69_00295 [Salmonella enterica subsp. enterica]|nr:hypothetical protein KCP69_00295 [Salmonella enterica subsp. enterica]